MAGLQRQVRCLLPPSSDLSQEQPVAACFNQNTGGWKPRCSGWASEASFVHSLGRLVLLLSCSPFSGKGVEIQRGDLLPASLTHKFTNSANLGTQGETPAH